MIQNDYFIKNSPLLLNFVAEDEYKFELLIQQSCCCKQSVKIFICYIFENKINRALGSIRLRMVSADRLDRAFDGVYSAKRGIKGLRVLPKGLCRRHSYGTMEESLRAYKAFNKIHFTLTAFIAHTITQYFY